ncbi:MAG: ABC transporter permease, partial [Rhodothermales bacterium]
MLENYLKIGLRTLRRYKGYTFINVVGLAVGMAVCVLILLYVQDELSYDRYHDHADRLYRVTHEKLDQNGNSSVHGVLTDPAVAPLLKAEFPEVIRAARLTPVGPLLSYEDRHIESGHCYWADPDLFDIFSMPLVAGRPETALVEPFSLVLSTSKARTLFGDEDPLGKTVVVNNNEAFTVTGVFEDLPNNTHLPIDVLGSMLTLERWFGKTLDHWNSPNYATYLRLAEGASPRQLAQKLPRLLEDYQGPEASRLNRLHLQPLTDIHLRSHLVMELAPNGDIRYVYLFSAVALFILLIACINFMNLATARSARRAKEVGMRKAVGARRTELIRQFLGESVLLAFLGLVLAVVLVELTLPFFNNFTGKDLGFRTEEFLLYLTIFASIGLLVGVLSGSYPAFYLSAFRPAAVLKGELRQGSRRSLVRSTLVVAQFA